MSKIFDFMDGAIFFWARAFLFFMIVFYALVFIGMDPDGFFGFAEKRAIETRDTLFCLALSLAGAIICTLCVREVSRKPQG